MSEELSLWALFVSAFISSTILPGGSEILLGVLLVQQVHAPALLLGVASLGNTLGGVTSWCLGWLIAKYYPVSSMLSSRRRSALRMIKKWGVLALLLSWLPLVGDALCVAAGWLRLNFLLSFVLIAVGKTLRYVFVVAAFS